MSVRLAKMDELTGLVERPPCHRSSLKLAGPEEVV